jgi:hypothetical protein
MAAANTPAEAITMKPSVCQPLLTPKPTVCTKLVLKLNHLRASTVENGTSHKNRNRLFSTLSKVKCMESIYSDMRESEKQVAAYLRELNLWWVYEFPVFVYDEKNRPRVWTPDFYIPKLGMYIEVCGSEDFNYRYRKEIYKKNGHNVIFVHLYKEKREWKNYLVKRIEEIEKLRHSEVTKLLRTP